MRLRAAVIALLLVSCAPEPAAVPEPEPVSTTLPPVSGPPPKPRPFETLAEAAAALDCTDLEDLGTGGNAGLRAFGVCYVGVHNIDIYLTSQRELWEHAGGQFPSVLGPEWIVVTPTGEDAARYVQSLIGGRVVVPTSPGADV